MYSQAIDQEISPSVLGTDQVYYCPQPLASGNRILELFPAPWEKYSGLLPDYTLNYCILQKVLTVVKDVSFKKFEKLKEYI